MLDVGFKNYIMINQIGSIIPPHSSYSRWLVKEAVAARKIINCTHGKRVGSLIQLKTRHIILSALKKNSLLKRLKAIPDLDSKIELGIVSKELAAFINEK